ncbi:MAG: site-2 protease family protein [Promethearchaeota archaeon]|jgi:Zn-dependent protease
MSAKNIFYRFEDIPNNSSTFSTGYAPKNIRFSFSKHELIQIFIAIIVLTIAFSFAFSPYPPLANLSSVITNIPISLIAIITAFFCHELAHKYMGQKYGYWSEFRMYGQGLLVALFLSIFTGFIFAAPGAVQIMGMPNREETGKIAVAGPGINIILSGIFFIITFVSTGLIAYIASFIGSINAFLALFNLIPLAFFDGRKIFSWRKDIWGFLIVMSIILLIT